MLGKYPRPWGSSPRGDLPPPAPPSRAEGAQGHSESKDKKTPEKPSLSHLVEKRSARGLCPGQVGVMRYVIWAILWPCALPERSC